MTMRSLINILEAAERHTSPPKAKRNSRLYHGTSIEALAGILSEDHVRGSEADDFDQDGDFGVSLTSSLGVAKKFAGEAKERDYDNRWESPVNDGVVLIFDGDAIRERVGTSRVRWDGSESEREHRTHGSIPNVTSYLIGILVDASAVAWWINAFDEAEEHDLAGALRSLPGNLVKNTILPAGAG